MECLSSSAYYGFLLISLIYFQDEVRCQKCRSSVESPDGGVRETPPGALTDKCPNQTDDVSRYRDLYHRIIQTISRNSKRAERSSSHKELKIDAKYKLPVIARRHKNMVKKDEKFELMDTANWGKKRFILEKSKDVSDSILHSDASRKMKREMEMSSRNASDSITAVKNNSEENKLILSMANDNNSIQKVKNMFEKHKAMHNNKIKQKKIQNTEKKQTPLFGKLVPNNLNRYSSQKKRDDNYYFLRFQNSDDENLERKTTLDPFWPRETKPVKRKPKFTTVLSSTQNTRTKMPTRSRFYPKRKIPSRNSNSTVKPRVEIPIKFKGFSSSAQKKLPILIADLFSKKKIKIFNGESTNSQDEAEVISTKQLKEVLSEEKVLEYSSFSNESISEENSPEEKSVSIEADNGLPTTQGTTIRNAIETNPESVGSASTFSVSLTVASSENSKSAEANKNSSADQLSKKEDISVIKAKSTELENYSSPDDIRNEKKKSVEDSAHTGAVNSLPVSQSIGVVRESQMNVSSTEVGSSSPEEQTADSLQEAQPADKTSAEELKHIKSISTEITELIYGAYGVNISLTDLPKITENTTANNLGSTDVSNSVQTNRLLRIENTFNRNSESTEVTDSVPKRLAAVNTSTENLDFIKANTTDDTEIIYRNNEDKKILTDLSNIKENIPEENLLSTVVSNSVSTRVENMSETNLESIEDDNGFLGNLTSYNTFADNLYSIKNNTTENTKINFTGYGSDSSLIDMHNIDKNTFTENLKATKAGSILTTNQTTRISNISETNPELADGYRLYSFTGSLTSYRTSADSSESANNNATENSDRITVIDSSITDMLNTDKNILAENLESTNADNILTTNQSTRGGNISQTDSASVDVNNSAPGRQAADSTSVQSSEFIKVKTTEAVRDIYKNNVSNSSFTGMHSIKENSSAQTVEFKEIDNSLSTSPTTGNTYETIPDIIQTEKSIPGRLALDSSFSESFESINNITTKSIETTVTVYRSNLGVVYTTSSKSSNSLIKNWTIGARNTSIMNLDSEENSNSFPEGLSANTTLTNNLESLKVNITEASEIIYKSYGNNNSWIDRSNSNESMSVENSSSSEADKSLSINKTSSIENASEINAESKEVTANNVPGRLDSNNASSENLEILKANTTEARERMHTAYGTQSSLTYQSNIKESTSSDSSGSS